MLSMPKEDVPGHHWKFMVETICRGNLEDALAEDKEFVGQNPEWKLEGKAAPKQNLMLEQMSVKEGAIPNTKTILLQQLKHCASRINDPNLAARANLHVKHTITDACNRIDGLRTWPTQGPLMMIASDDFNIQLVVGGMEERGWRLLGVNNPPAIHLTIDVMDEPDLQRFVDDLDEVCAKIRSGELKEEGLLSYGGVGAEEDAPKWLLSAVEIMEQQAGG